MRGKYLSGLRGSFLFCFAFLVATVFWPAALASAFTLRWAVMAVGAPLFLLLSTRDEVKLLTDPLLCLGMLLCIAAVPLAWAVDVPSGREELIHLVIGAGIFCVGAAAPNLINAWRGLAVGMAVSAVIAAAQLAGWEGVISAAPPGGLFINKNVLAEAGLVSLLATFAYRMPWWWAAPGAACVAMGTSRAVFGALVVMAAVWLYRRGHRVVAAFVVASIAGALLWAFTGGIESATVRLGFWREGMIGVHWYGNGLGSFPIAFPFAVFAHNEFIHYAYELGVFALPAAGCLIYLLMERAYAPEHVILIALVAVACFSFPLHIPVTLFAAALAAGHLAMRRDPFRSNIYTR